jgi:hypothetical protein
MAGYRYSAGQGSIHISEFNLIVASVNSLQEEDPISPPPSPIDLEEGTSGIEGEEGAAEGDNKDNDSDEDDNTILVEDEQSPAAPDIYEREEGVGLWQVIPKKMNPPQRMTKMNKK